MKKIYLDNHTTTRPSPAAVQGMEPFLTKCWGVPAAPHAMGEELRAPCERAYRQIYALLGAQEYDSFVFTSSGTEAVNHVVWAAYLDLAREGGRNHMITSAVDEAPVILALERLEQLGCETTLAPVNEHGLLTPEALGDAIQPRTGLVSLSWANALTGAIQPVVALAELCRQRGIWFHLDATHVLGKVPFDLDEIAPDLVSFNGDHLHAPKGTGGLWVRSGLRLSPLLLGGMEQDGHRAGPFSVAQLVALGIAAEEACQAQDRVGTEVAYHRSRLEAGICARVPEAQILFAAIDRLPTTTVVAFPGITSDALLYTLSRRGIFASFGGGTYQQLGLQLEAMGVSPHLARCAISLSLSRDTTAEEVDAAVEIIAEVVSRLRKVSKELV